MNALNMHGGADVAVDAPHLSLIEGDFLCASVTEARISRGILSDGVTGVSVGSQLVAYSESAIFSLHEMIAAGYLLKCGVAVDGQKLVCPESSILVLFSTSAFVWSAKNIPVETWSSNVRCNILQVGHTRSGISWDHGMDCSFHLKSEALVLMQPGAEVRRQTKRVCKGRNGAWRKFIPFLDSQPELNTESMEEATFTFDGCVLR